MKFRQNFILLNVCLLKKICRKENDSFAVHLLLQIIRNNVYSSNYESIVLVGDLNSEINDKCMNDFCETKSLNSLITESTCYKNSRKLSRIDLFTNSSSSFENCNVVETSLSDFHRMIVPRVRLRDFDKERHFMSATGWPTKKILGLRWS